MLFGLFKFAVVIVAVVNMVVSEGLYWAHKKDGISLAACRWIGISAAVIIILYILNFSPLRE